MLFLIPVYGYMASAWAHIASYGSMIIMSFIFAEKHYKVNYNMKDHCSIFYYCNWNGYFWTSILIIRNLIAELLINTLFIIIFIRICTI